MFLKVAVVLTGTVALALLLWEPRVEGRNAHATNFEIYFQDPFLAFVYIGSIPFFMGLYQAFKALGYAEQGRLFPREIMEALRNIRYCAFAVIAFVAVEKIFIILNHGNDDPAGGVFIGVLITLGSMAVIATAKIFEKILRKAVSTKTGSS